MIILIVSNENLILNTIKSRCLKLYFNNLTEEEIKRYIDNKINCVESDKLRSIESIHEEIYKLVIDRIKSMER